MQFMHQVEVHVQFMIICICPMHSYHLCVTENMLTLKWEIRSVVIQAEERRNGNMINLATLSFSYYKDFLDSTVPTLSYLNMLMDCNDSLRSRYVCTP